MGQKGFFDIAQRYAGLDAKNDPLARIDEVVPWEDFRPRLEAAWRKPTEERKSPAGRKPWDAVVMFKAIVLCELYNLSDDQVEYQLRDRLSFMRFLGLGLEDKVPDAKTVWLYREQLAQAGVIETLFEDFDGYLEPQGYLAMGGQIIDASIVPVPKQRNSGDDNARIKEGETPEGWENQPAKRSQKDTDARWTKKHGKSHYGRSGAHPEKHLTGFTGILQADAYAGYNRLYALGRSPGPVTEALCWAHARRKFFVLADIAASAKRGAKKGKAGAIISPLAFEAVTRIDALFDVEREINRLSAEGRLTVRAERSAPLLAELEAWLRAERARLSRHAPVAKAMDYMLKRWPGFARFLEDGRVCLTNNAAERALRGIALGRKAWLFAGSDRGGHRAAFMYTLIVTAKINDVDPQAWLADVLARIADHSSQRLDELLPWNWKQAQAADTLAA